MTLDSSGNLVVGTTGTAQGRVHAHATTNAQFVATDATLGTTYGGVFRGYGVVGQGGNAELGVLDNGSYTKAIKILDNATGIQFFTGVTNAGSTERARITSVGNFKIGGTADRATTEGTNQLVLFNGTAPVGTLTNGVSFYSESGEARVMDAAGNSTLLSPHDTATNEWIFHSKHTPTGKVLRIDVERLLKFVNDHFGLDAVHEFCSLPPADPANFTPYADLTQDQVLGWIWANGVDKDATEAAVQQQIDNQINPPVIQPPLPWAA